MYTAYTGTKSVIDACKICKVKRLIHTSSSSVVFDGVRGLFNVNESLPYPDKVASQFKLIAQKICTQTDINTDIDTDKDIYIY
jgi:sterol-4alpha-carboxylate 3-dehydrogenase (decarboxylating)